ncbi:MAG TPA: hypothetical protein VLF69_03300 [Candidatus Saccharimonadales bacterium]|nr:hypothetical protein [Candidatus Saccharimonadales bacterium]
MKWERRSVYYITAAVLVLLAGYGLWWTRVRQDPNRVFWDMLSNNLSTSGVTRTVIQTGQGLSVSQYTQLSLGQHPTAHALTVFSQGASTLATEEISDQTHDLVRYQRIDLPKTKATPQLNTKVVLGKWASLQSGQSVSGQLTSGLFGQSLLDVMPMANLPPAQRDSLLQTMHRQHVFSYNEALVKKTKLNGREVYLYAVNIKPDAYIRLMQQFESLIGGTAYGALKAANAAQAKPISVVLSVDARSHELSQLYETAAKRTETYQGFGITESMALPRATITTSQLTQRLGQLLQP